MSYSNEFYKSSDEFYKSSVQVCKGDTNVYDEKIFDGCLM